MPATIKMAVTVLLGLFAWSAAITSQAALILTVGDVYYLGKVIDGSPASEEVEAGYINFLLDMPISTAVETCAASPHTDTCDRIGSTLDATSLHDATADGASKDETDPSNSIDLTGWEYLLVKYGGGQGGGSYVWYVGDLNSTYEVPELDPTEAALSHWTLFNSVPVPEPNTLALLAIGLAGLGFAKRRKSSPH